MAGEELQSNGLKAGEETPQQGAPPSETPPVPEGQPTEPAQQYLTRDEALEIVDQALGRQREAYEQAAQEFGRRGGQSVVDKRRLNERLQSVEDTLGRLVQDGLLDESQASAYRQEARWQALTGIMPEEPEPQAGGGEGPGPDPMQARFEQLITESGLQPGDPEYGMLYGHPDPFAAFQALERAKAAKAARLAREQAAQRAAGGGQPGAAAPAQPAPAGARAMELSSGGAGGAPTLEDLQKQLTAASNRNDIAEMERIGELIDDIVYGGG